MLFNSFEYFLFLIIVVPIYYLSGNLTFRTLWLLAASCIFYMYFIPVYILILFLVIIIDYFSGLALGHEKLRAYRKLFLLLSICSNVGILVFFKYFNFFAENAELLTGRDLFRLNVILPIGLSFHTFQSLSYIIEVYRGKYPAEKRLDVFALYVLFFPQLVAGPIERPQNVLPQLHKVHAFNSSLFTRGLWMISIGLIKKCVLADRLSPFADAVFADPASFGAGAVLAGCIFFSLQIYFDFSGYSDIALGSAACLGIHLMRNFDDPYRSHSIREFWTRWHVSLSSWFRDYVFIPLGGSRVSALKHFRNLMIVFGLSGLWHGASWNFVVWGLLHGLLVFGSARLDFSFGKIGPLRVLDVAFNFMLVTLLWVFFRAPGFGPAMEVFKGLTGDSWSVMSDLVRHNFGLLSIAVTLAGLLYLRAWRNGTTDRSSPMLRPSLAWATVNFLVLFAFGIFNEQSFIYFQF
jgi:alginate O-acetyltransferase complex protein AlgI